MRVIMRHPDNEIREQIFKVLVLLVQHEGTPGKATDQIMDLIARHTSAACREARIDEWNYIETVREASDNAILKVMDERIGELKNE